MITLIIGLIIGACLGLLVAGICQTSGNADEIAYLNYKDSMIEQLAEALMDARLALKEAKDDA